MLGREGSGGKREKRNRVRPGWRPSVTDAMCSYQESGSPEMSIPDYRVPVGDGALFYGVHLERIIERSDCFLLFVLIRTTDLFYFISNMELKRLLHISILGRTQADDHDMKKASRENVDFESKWE